MAVKDKTNVFTLGSRVDILNNMDAPVIVPHAAEEQQQRFPFEAIFRNITRVFIDNASSEFLFCSEFFQAPKSKKATDQSGGSATSVTMEMFQEVFGKTTKMILVS